MVVVVMAAVMVIVVAVARAVVVMAPGKGFRKNPEKFSPRKKGGLPSGFLMREGAWVGVIGVPINTSPA